MNYQGHLSLKDREQLFGYRKQGLSFRAAGKKLNRDHTVLSREYRRNRRAGEDYLPCKAHKRYCERAKSQRTKAPLRNHEIYLYVREKLRLYWSPEVVAGRLPIDHPGNTITAETIYSYIYGKGKKYKLWKYLPMAKKKRKKKTGRKTRRESRVPNALSIDKRPKKVEKRRQSGHIETDLMEGARGGAKQHHLSVIVERKMRYVCIDRVRNKKAETKDKIMRKRIEMLNSVSKSNRPLVRSVTYDNGSENFGHMKLRNEFGINTYFCHAYHSWEKGSVENRIKRIRRFLPKGTDLSLITDEQIQFVEDLINDAPMKCLKFMKPREMLEEEANKYKFRRLLKKKLEIVSGAFQL